MQVLFVLVCIWLSVVVGATFHKNTFFASNSAWRAKLPDNAPISGNSGEYVKDLLRQINYTGYVWINSDYFTVPIYYADANQATTSVRVLQNNDAQFQAKANVVPMPADAKPSVGSDEDEERENLREKDVANVSSNPGYYVNPYPTWGVAATSIPLAGGTMTVADAQAGIFPYALKITLQDYASGYFVAPALRTDGNGKSTTPQGTRFRLPASYNISSIPNSFARMMATAMRDYGLITTDTSGGVVLSAEDITQYGGTNPWHSIWGTEYPSAVCQYIPWDKLEVVDPSWQPWNPMSQYYQYGDYVAPSNYIVTDSLTLFDDSLASGWSDYSWATTNFANTNPTFNGSRSISVVYSESKAFYLHVSGGGNINTTRFNAVEFIVCGNASEPNYKWHGFSIIQLVNNGSQIGGRARLGSYFTYGTPTVWTKVRVPFADMGWVPGTPVQGFWIQSQISVSAIIDEVRLLHIDPIYPSPPTASTTTGPTAGPTTTGPNNSPSGPTTSASDNSSAASSSMTSAISCIIICLFLLLI